MIFSLLLLIKFLISFKYCNSIIHIQQNYIQVIKSNIYLAFNGINKQF